MASSLRLNRVIELMEKRQPAFGIFSSNMSPRTGASLAASKLDFVIVDLEHSPFDLSRLETYLLSMVDKRQILEKQSLQPNVVPLVRVPAIGREQLLFVIKQVLDLGPFGIVVPQIETKEEALLAVKACRYAQLKGVADYEPEGLRGVGYGWPARQWGLSGVDYGERADLWPLDAKGEMLLWLMIETRRGVENCREIIQTPGIGCIFIGPSDLAFSLGVPLGDPAVDQAMDTVVTACREAGVRCGTLIGGDEVERRLRQGFQILAVGGDAGLSGDVEAALRRESVQALGWARAADIDHSLLAMSKEKLRWGIVGTAKIVGKNWRAIGHSGNGTVTAVASRNLDRSRQFIAERQAEHRMDPAPKAFGSYEELLASPEVDAVYIPLPTGVRKEWVIQAAAAKKHIVCEKPCAVTVTDLEEMLQACRRNRVQFMDGVMFMHDPRLQRLRATIDDGVTIGAISRITSDFTVSVSPDFFSGNIRIQTALEPHGCLGDLGWYCIRFVLWAMNWQLPSQVSGRILAKHEQPGGAGSVPTDFSGELIYDKGVSAAFRCSFVSANQQWVVINGTKGNIQIPDFVLPAGQDPKGSPSSQESTMFRNFADQVRSGTLSEFWPDIARKTQQVMNACNDAARKR